MTKFYIEIDDQPPFVCEAPSQHHAILAYWKSIVAKLKEISPEALRYLDASRFGFETEYRMHFGKASEAITVKSHQAFLLAPSAMKFVAQWGIAAGYGEEGIDRYFEDLLNPELKTRVRYINADGSFVDKLV